VTPHYETELGRAFLGDARDVMVKLPAESVNLIVTSPPFPLTFQKKKPYGTVKIAEFLDGSKFRFDQAPPVKSYRRQKRDPRQGRLALA
jgi:DNA modification methylase